VRGKLILGMFLLLTMVEGASGLPACSEGDVPLRDGGRRYLDVSGVWLWSRASRDDGTQLNNYFVLQQEGSVLAGRIEYAWGGFAPFLDGVVQGNHLQFKVNEGSAAAEYSGIIAGERLRLTVRSRGGSTLIELKKVPIAKSIHPPEPVPPPIRALSYNGLAKSPPMGWNAWNHFHDYINDKIVREIVDAMVANGMRDAGYRYVNIDDEWAGVRDANGTISANRNFPDMKGLADYIHGKGMKLGLYSSPGPETCEGHSGSLGNEKRDAETYAKWGVDYLKYDWCSASFVYQDSDMRAVYQTMGAALQETGRPIIYSLCQYGRAGVAQWGRSVGANLWRTTPDIQDNWSSMLAIWKAQQAVSKMNRSGGWNDPDMLEVGNGGMSEEEYRTHFSLWALLSAPLLAGNDPRNMSPSTIAILTNKDVIAIDQDALAAPPRLLRRDGQVELWVKSLANGDSVVLLLNPADQSQKIDLRWSDFAPPNAVTIQDLWQHRSIAGNGTEHLRISAHGVRMFRLRGNRTIVPQSLAH
jgi:alpha-galactosidase